MAALGVVLVQTKSDQIIVRLTRTAVLYGI